MLTAVFGFLTWRVVRAHRRGAERNEELQGRLVGLLEPGADG